jgi:hypothetical protein
VRQVRWTLRVRFRGNELLGTSTENTTMSIAGHSKIIETLVTSAVQKFTKVPVTSGVKPEIPV